MGVVEKIKAFFKREKAATEVEAKPSTGESEIETTKAAEHEEAKD